MRPVILGLDASSTAIGWCLIRQDGVIVSGTLRPKGDLVWPRVLELRTWLSALIIEERIGHIALEQPLRSDATYTDEVNSGHDLHGRTVKVRRPIGNFKTLRALYAIAGEVQVTACALNCAVEEVNQMSWRPMFFGSGHRPPKGLEQSKRSSWWKKEAIRHCELRGYRPKGHDEAEACAIAMVALSKLQSGFSTKPGDLFATTREIPRA